MFYRITTTVPLAGLVLLVASVAAGQQAVASDPPEGARFTGVACVDFECHESVLGKQVVAMINDIECGSAVTEYPPSDGEIISLYDITVASADEQPGCGTDGAEVEFYIDGRLAAPTAVWHEGKQGLHIRVGEEFAGFSGSLTCDGGPCFPCGVMFCSGPLIAAYIDGTLCGSIRPHGWLITSRYSLLAVKPDAAQPGCGVEGASITFTVDGRPANETAVWSVGFFPLDLSVNGRPGDVDCSDVVNTNDSLQILRLVAGLTADAGCLEENGDVDCSGAIDSIDALRILLAVANMPRNTPAGCPPILT